MKFRLGFESEQKENEYGFSQQSTAKKSVVQVFFPDKGMTFPYFNDLFNLNEGDIVYVEGKFEGVRGIVTSVNYNFKIRINDYMKVIGVADTDITGTFYHTLTHFITFNPETLPVKKVLSWYKTADENEYEYGTDDSAFPLDDLDKMEISDVIRNRGVNYYKEGRVRYISLNGSKGIAVVEGGEIYTVEFEYNDGQIINLLCDCYCSYNCKHMYAAMLQLKALLEDIDNNYQSEFRKTHCFAAVCKDDMYNICLRNKKSGCMEL